MIDPNSFSVDKTIWACADATNSHGNGSKTNPFRTGGDLDLLVLGPSVRLRLLPGKYTTRGIAFGKVFILDADSKDVTITLLPVPAATPAVSRMFCDWGNWCSFVSIRNVTLDGNYLNHPGSQTGNFKVEPISVQTIIGEVSNVTIRNFGAAAKDYGLLGLECFPLSLTTFASGDRAIYDPRYSNINELTPSRLEITGCTVEKPHFTDGGYCTGIFVKASLGMDKGDRQKFGTRSSQAVLVCGNTVNVPGGICYGAANVEKTTFVDNTGIGKCAFNLDTGVADKLDILNNRFPDVSQGLNLCPDSGGSRIKADGNTIVITSPFYNKVTNKFEDQWGIKAGMVGMSSASKNTFIVPSDWSESDSRVMSGIKGIGNITQHAQSNTPVITMPTDTSKINELEAKLSEVLLSSATKIAELQKLNEKLVTELAFLSAILDTAKLNISALEKADAAKTKVIAENQARLAKFVEAITNARAVFNSL